VTDHEYCTEQTCEHNPAVPEVELEARPTEVGTKAAAEVQAIIRERSFSGRHPELGKMINCQACNTRHRQNERKCVQVFTTVVDRGPYEETVPERRTPQTIKGVMGAAQFKGKRLRPPLNKRANQFVELVRSFLKNEYTEDDMRKAKTKARLILAEKHGRFGFLEPKWKKNVQKTTE
jgi:hypothetical protein